MESVKCLEVYISSAMLQRYLITSILVHNDVGTHGTAACHMLTIQAPNNPWAGTSKVVCFT